MSSVILVIYRLNDVENLLEKYLLIIYLLLKVLTGKSVSGNDKVGSGDKFIGSYTGFSSRRVKIKFNQCGSPCEEVGFELVFYKLFRSCAEPM